MEQLRAELTETRELHLRAVGEAEEWRSAAHASACAATAASAASGRVSLRQRRAQMAKTAGGSLRMKRGASTMRDHPSAAAGAATGCDRERDVCDN